MFKSIARRLYPPITADLMAERELHEAQMGVILHASLSEQCDVDSKRLADDAVHHQRLTRMYEDRVERLTDKKHALVAHGVTDVAVFVRRPHTA